MKYWKVCVLPVFLGALGVTLFAADKPPENFQQAMKDLAAFSQGVPKASAAGDFEGVAKLANSAKAAFMVVDAFFTAKADAAATKTARDSVKFSADLAVVAGLMSKEGVDYSAKLLTDTCAGCHAAHREKAADGSWQIK